MFQLRLFQGSRKVTTFFPNFLVSFLHSAVFSLIFAVEENWKSVSLSVALGTLLRTTADGRTDYETEIPGERMIITRNDSGLNRMSNLASSAGRISARIGTTYQKGLK